MPIRLGKGRYHSCTDKDPSFKIKNPYLHTSNKCNSQANHKSLGQGFSHSHFEPWSTEHPDLFLSPVLWSMWSQRRSEKTLSFGSVIDFPALLIIIIIINQALFGPWWRRDEFSYILMWNLHVCVENCGRQSFDHQVVDFCLLSSSL